MNQVRFSLTGLLAFVAFVAVGCAAMIYASLWWAAFCLSLSLAILAFAVLGVVYRTAGHRAFWVGFAFVGCGYLILVYAPGFDRYVGWRLLTTKVIAVIQPHVQQTSMDWDLHASQLALAEYPEPPATITETRVHWDLPQWYFFQQIGHSICSMVLAWLGGLTSQYLHTKTTAEQNGIDHNPNAS